MKRVLSVSLVVVLLATIVMGTAAIAQASSDEIVVYGWAGNWDLWFENWAREFKNETGISLKYLSGPGVQMFQRIVAEKNAPKADVFVGTPSHSFTLASMDLLADLPWDKMSNAPDVDDRFKFPKVAIWGYDLHLIGYNADYISPDEAPTSWRDLADPRWKGKLAMNEPSSETALRHWMVLADKFGEDVAWDVTEKMFQNAVKTINTPGETERTVATGEAPLVPLSMGQVMVAVQQAGGNVQAVPPSDGAFLMLNSISMIKNSPNPEGALKFVNWYLGKYAQNDIMNNLGISIAVNKTVPLTNKGLSEIGLGGNPIDEILSAAHVPDWSYWVKKVDGDKTNLDVKIQELERRIKGLK